MFGQGKSEVDVVLIRRFQTERAGDINWLCRPRLVFQATRVRLDFTPIDFDLGLRRKRHMLGAVRIWAGAEQHDSVGRVIDTLL